MFFQPWWYQLFFSFHFLFCLRPLFFSSWWTWLKVYQFCLSFIYLFIYFESYVLFCFSFIFISWRLITLQYCSGFCHTLTWISHGFTCISPSHLPLHTIPGALGRPRGIRWRGRWEGGSGWGIHVNPWLIHVSCCLETSHPRLHPQSPKFCSVHLCLFFCFAYRVIITIFLNSIYMC